MSKSNSKLFCTELEYDFLLALRALKFAVGEEGDVSASFGCPIWAVFSGRRRSMLTFLRAFVMSLANEESSPQTTCAASGTCPRPEAPTSVDFTEKAAIFLSASVIVSRK